MAKTTTEENASVEVKFKRKSALCVPQLKLTPNRTVFIEVSSPIKMIEIPDKNSKTGKSECPSVKVIDMEDGEIKELLLDKIPHDAFIEFGDEIVGKRLEMTKGTKVQSGVNGYHPYTIYELE